MVSLMVRVDLPWSPGTRQVLLLTDGLANEGITDREPLAELASAIKAEGIATAIHYPKPLHLQPAMAAAGGKPGDLPVSEQLCREVLCLPLYPELPLDTLREIAACVARFHEVRVA